MKFTVNRTELLAAAQKAERIAPRVSTIEILQCAYLQAEQDTLTVASGNLEIAFWCISSPTREIGRASCRERV